MTLNPARLQWADDGSFASADYGDVYFLRHQGPVEKYYVFIDGNRLTERFRTAAGTFRVGETGFGTGLNFILTARAFLTHAAPDTRLFYAAIEKHPITPADLPRVFDAIGMADDPLAQEIMTQYPPLQTGFHHLHLAGGRIRLMLCFGDIKDVLPEMTGAFDAWHLDGFAPDKNPEMWAPENIRAIGRLTRANGTAATFSAAGTVRQSLADAGFTPARIKGFANKRHMTIATRQGATRQGATQQGEDTPAQTIRRIAVIGAGIAGCAAAHALAVRGYDVTLFDKNDNVAQETSGNPAAVIAPKLARGMTGFAQYYRHAFCYGTALARYIAPDIYQPCGIDYHGKNADELQKYREIIAEGIDRAATLHGDIIHMTGGYLIPQDYCRRLTDHPRINRVFNHTQDTLPTGFDAVVIATGAQANGFTETSWLTLSALRGQVTTLRARADIPQVISYDGYITPAFDHAGEQVHCIGATFSRNDPDLTSRDGDDDENIARLRARLPQYDFTRDDITGNRTGLRMTSQDKLPVIGACPDAAAARAGDDTAVHPRLYIAAAFGAYGMTGAALAAEIIAADIHGDPAPVPRSVLAAVDPRRHLRRLLKNQV